MRAWVLAILVVFSQQSVAGCESVLLEGGHTALTKKEAQLLAWEEAKDACYPGQATKLDLECMAVEGDIGVNGKAAIRCFQEISCNLCDEALTLKYEALD
jgi:hypothetical protein